MGRAPCCDKANVKKGPWSPEEDAKLKAYIEQNGTGGNWIALPQKIGLKRCGKSCRLRWLNYLRPNIKHGGFSEEEDNIICSLYISIGSRWSIIAAQLPGRTDNDIKNYWNTRLKKKLLGRKKGSNTSRSNGSEESSYSHQISSSALERFQLHLQLQSIQDPLSLYNSLAIWPKLHPFQEKLILQSLNESYKGNPFLRPDAISEKVAACKPVESNSIPDTSSSQTFKVSEFESSDSPLFDSFITDDDWMALPTFTSMKPSGSSSSSATTNLQPEFDDFRTRNQMVGFGQQEDPISSLDCSKTLNEGRDSLVWWPTDFESKSSSKVSPWDYQLSYIM